MSKKGVGFFRRKPFSIPHAGDMMNAKTQAGSAYPSKAGGRCIFLPIPYGKRRPCVLS